MNINIQHSNCLCCGELGATTIHHAIPKWMEPKHNMTVPLCQKCHNRLNNKDTKSLLMYLVKLNHTLEVNIGEIEKTYNQLKDYVKEEEGKK